MGYSKKEKSHFLEYQKLDGSIITFVISMQNTIMKKYSLVFNPINEILDNDEDLNILYDEFVTLMNEKDNLDEERIKEILPELVERIDKNAEELGYWKFSYTAPKKISEFKLHIDKDGYLDIMKASVRCKFVAVFIALYRDKNISLIRYIYSYICKEIINSGVQFKIERIIDSIILSTSARGLDSKSQLWLFFSTSKGIDPQNIALKERNGVFYKGLPTIATGLDPLKWFVSMARTSIRFQMKDKINEANIVFNAPIDSCYENASDMLRIFVYEEVTSNRKLRKLFKEFPFAIEMSREYVYPITNWIAAPFISQVFNVSNLNVSHLINILLLNIYVYKFLRDQENDWILFKMLTYKASVRNNEQKMNDGSFKYTIPSNSVRSRRMIGSNIFTSRNLSSLIDTNLELLKFNEKSIYTKEQLFTLFKFAIKNLLSYDYFDYLNNKIVIDPVDFTIQYIGYIYNLITHKYDNTIESARLFLRG